MMIRRVLAYEGGGRRGGGDKKLEKINKK